MRVQLTNQQFTLLRWRILLFFLYTAVHLHSLEVDAKTGLMLFDPGLKNASEIAVQPDTEFNFIESLQIKQRYLDLISFDLIVDHDPILLNRLLARFGLNTSIFSLHAGPFFGLFNGPDILNPGISLIAAANVAGFIFGSFQFDTTINAGVNQPGDYSQNAMACTIGFELPIGLKLAGNMNRKVYTKKQQENGALITSKQTQYYVSAEWPEKLLFFSRIQGSIGYQELEWSAALGSWSAGYQHDSIYGGLHLDFDILPWLSLYLGGEAALYSWARQQIQKSAPVEMLFCEFFLGAIWKFDTATRNR